MKSKLSVNTGYLCLILLTVLFLYPLLPQFAFAQGLVPCSGSECGTCQLVTLAENIIDILIIIMVGIAAILIAYAGYLMVISAGNASKFQRGKGIFTNVIIGLIIMLVAWLIIDTMLRTLLPNGVVAQNASLPWNRIQCTTQFALQDGAVTTFGDSWEDIDFIPTLPDGTQAPAGDASLAGGGMSDALARSLFNTAGISMSSSVSLEGIQPHMIDEVIALNQSCNCNVHITSATDGNHAAGTFSHGTGFKVDLRTRDNPTLVNYVQTLPYSGSWSDGTRTYYDAASCGTYAVEGDHIDVVYRTGC